VLARVGKFPPYGREGGKGREGKGGSSVRLEEEVGCVCVWSGWLVHVQACYDVLMGGGGERWNRVLE